MMIIIIFVFVFLFFVHFSKSNHHFFRFRKLWAKSFLFVCFFSSRTKWINFFEWIKSIQSIYNVLPPHTHTQTFESIYSSLMMAINHFQKQNKKTTIQIGNVSSFSWKKFSNLIMVMKIFLFLFFFFSASNRFSPNKGIIIIEGNLSSEYMNYYYYYWWLPILIIISTYIWPVRGYLEIFFLLFLFHFETKWWFSTQQQSSCHWLYIWIWMLMSMSRFNFFSPLSFRIIIIIIFILRIGQIFFLQQKKWKQSKIIYLFNDNLWWLFFLIENISNHLPIDDRWIIISSTIEHTHTHTNRNIYSTCQSMIGSYAYISGRIQGSFIMSILIYPTMAINVSILTKIHNSKESKSTELNILTNHKFQSKRSEDKPNQIMKMYTRVHMVVHTHDNSFQ